MVLGISALFENLIIFFSESFSMLNTHCIFLGSDIQRKAGDYSDVGAVPEKIFVEF